MAALGLHRGAQAFSSWSEQGPTHGLVALQHVESSWTRDWTHVPCTGDTVPPRNSLNIYSSKLLFWFVHELFLLKLLSEEMIFFISCSCRKNFKSFLQRHWAYGWLAASDISRFHPGNITVLSEFSQGIAECLFLKAFSQGLRMVFQPGNASCFLQ